MLQLFLVFWFCLTSLAHLFTGRCGGPPTLCCFYKKIARDSPIMLFLSHCPHYLHLQVGHFFVTIGKKRLEIKDKNAQFSNNWFLLIFKSLKPLNFHNRKINNSSLKKDAVLLMLILISSSYPWNSKITYNYICFKTLRCWWDAVSARCFLEFLQRDKGQNGELKYLNTLFTFIVRTIKEC